MLRSNPSTVTAAVSKRVDPSGPDPTARSIKRVNPSAPDARKINGLISGETRARELLDLHAKYGPSFDAIHLATCWSRLGRVSAADRRVNPCVADTVVQRFTSQAMQGTRHAAEQPIGRDGSGVEEGREGRPERS